MSGSLGLWAESLQPASWRGLPFAVRSSEYRRGRRFAVHEYPKRPKPWAEDMGQATRAVAFSGFVVGEDCFDQAQDLLEASEAEGAGVLVHPSLGTLTVALVAPLTATERTELGRVVELRFEFIETGTPIYPDDTTSTQDDVATSATAANSAVATDVQSSISPAASSAPATTYTDSSGNMNTLPSSSSGIAYQGNIGQQTTTGWGALATQQGSDPLAVSNSAAGIAPPAGSSFSRYDGNGVDLTFSNDTPAVQEESAMETQTAATQSVSSEAMNANAAALSFGPTGGF